MIPAVLFTHEIYDEIRPGAQRSAAVVVPLVQRIVAAQRVVDVGGGEGWWAAAFAAEGANAVCIDNPTPSLVAPGVQHVEQDLSLGLPRELGGFDLAVCLEVVEHVDATIGDRLVADLCEIAPSILFSAAIPGQGGHGHVNEQWPGYWVKRFANVGYRCSGALRWTFWEDEAVEPWYRQNLLFVTRESEAYAELFATPLTEPWPVVHPGTFRNATGT
jgi:hypothetical protein